MAGYLFTYNQEIGHQGQSLVPHFPGGASGVTIGPGYDMKYREPDEIYRDLTGIGVAPEMAYALAGAAHLSGEEAGDWVSHAGGIYLTEEQQQELFVRILVPQYEDRLRQQLYRFAASEGIPQDEVAWDGLSDRQKEALFDFVYNTGSIERFPELARAVILEDWDTASQHYERFSGGEPLEYRNQMFFREFLDTSYTHEPQEWASGTVQENETGSEFADLYLSSIADDQERGEPDADGEFTDDWYDSPA